jgi:hypothetical protein
MRHNGIEQIVIVIAVVLFSIISNLIQNKKKGGPQSGTPRRRPSEPPVPHWPSPNQWQEEVRRLLERGETTRRPPPLVASIPSPQEQTPQAPPIRASSRRQSAEEETLSPASPLRASVTAYTRAAQLDREVGERLQVIEKETEQAKPARIAAAPLPMGAREFRRWTRSPEAARSALIASLIFGKPKALEQAD